MKTLLGSQLSYSEQQKALSRFVHRMTKENILKHPAYAQRQFKHGYRMPIITDCEWLACTEFTVTKSGKLDERVNHCYCKQPLPVNA